RYGCSTHRHAGPSACDNALTVRSDVAERRILEFVRERLLSAEAVELALERIRELAKAEASAPSPDLARLEAEIAELERLRAAGVVSAETIAPALERAYRQRERAARPAAKALTAVFGAER